VLGSIPDYSTESPDKAAFLLPQTSRKIREKNLKLMDDERFDHV
jgi:hypothetical protein